jgi:mannose-6-phosphate isomerase
VIDARERTSLQVHPDAASATRLGGEPKTEMWYALPEMGEGRVLAGLAPGVDRGAFARAIEAGDPERAVRAVDLRAGEAILVPAGRVHAIEAGCFLLEIQQNSDTTLRVFDWGRTGPDGAPRTLHLAEAMEAIDWDDPPAAPVLPRSAWRHGGNAGWEILAGEHFRVGRMELREPWREENDGRSFRALFVEAGAVELTGGGEILTLEHGASALLPAGLRECELRPAREAGAAAASVIVTTRG